MKSLLCKLGFHKEKKGWHKISRKYSFPKHKLVNYYWAYCSRCHKKLHRVDRWGERR